MKDFNVVVPQKNVFIKQGEYVPLGDQLNEYWRRFGNNFPKLAQIVNILKFWPSTSTILERIFSQIAAQYDKRRSMILPETLLNLHNTSRSSRDFIEALKKTCADLGIDTE